MDMLAEYTLTTSKYVLIILSIIIIVRCIRSMLSERYEPEVWAYLSHKGQIHSLTHWENIIGRSYSSDLRLASRAVSRVAAVLRRSDKGEWRIFEVFSKGGVWVNGVKSGEKGLSVQHGDQINIGGETLRFNDISAEQRMNYNAYRTAAGHRVSPSITLG